MNPTDFSNINLFHHEFPVHGLELDSTSTKSMCVISGRSLKEYKVQDIRSKRVDHKSRKTCICIFFLYFVKQDWNAKRLMGYWAAKQILQMWTLIDWITVLTDWNCWKQITLNNSLLVLISRQVCVYVFAN